MGRNRNVAPACNPRLFNDVKGLMAVLIVMSHLRIVYASNEILDQLASFGSISVSVFFFMSGYGLVKQFVGNNMVIRDDFLSHRYSKVLPSFLLATVLWILFIIVSDGEEGIIDFVNEFKRGYPPLPHSWFMFALLYLYLGYWLTFRRQRSMLASNLIMMGMTALYYFVMRVGLKWEGYWYDSVFAFNLGVLISCYEGRIVKIFEKRIVFALFSTAVAAVTIVALRHDILHISNMSVCMLVWIACLYSRPIDKPVTRFLGRYGYEIYLVQGAVLTIFAVHHEWANRATVISLFLIISVIFIAAIFLRSIAAFITRKRF